MALLSVNDFVDIIMCSVGLICLCECSFVGVYVFPYLRGSDVPTNSAIRQSFPILYLMCQAQKVQFAIPF